MQTLNSFNTALTNSRIPLILLTLLFLLSSGCVVKDMGNVVKHNIKGQHYLSQDDYSKGAKKFKKEVAENPESASANYYYGRFLLGDKQSKKALRYLKKARKLDPNNADYHFWTGVAYSNLGQKSQEAKSYLKALSIKDDHLQSLIYLGHSRLESKQYSNALINYSRALKIWPTSPSALYNRALATTKLGRKPEALEGWQEYLSHYPSGAMARQAVTHLNRLGDFSFRNHTLHTRTVTTGKIYFEPFTDKISRKSRPSLELIGTIYNNMTKKGRLHIVVYQLNNKKLAKRKALSIKKFLVDNNKKIQSKNIGTSWFSTPETIKVQGVNRRINDSVSFFIAK